MDRHSFEQQIAPTHYYDKNFDCDAVKILPGEYYITNRDTLIVTVLGSCVSVCLRDRHSGAGGMNHFMLPGNEHEHNAAGNSARYGNYAMEVLIEHLLQLGAQRINLEAKIFGGGHVMSVFNANNIGERNAEFVQRYLQTERIPIIARDLFDIFPRKVYFFPATGRVLIRKLKSLNNNTILEREVAYSKKLRKSPQQDEVELSRKT